MTRHVVLVSTGAALIPCTISCCHACTSCLFACCACMPCAPALTAIPIHVLLASLTFACASRALPSTNGVYSTPQTKWNQLGTYCVACPQAPIVTKLNYQSHVPNKFLRRMYHAFTSTRSILALHSKSHACTPFVLGQTVVYYLEPCRHLPPVHVSLLGMRITLLEKTFSEHAAHLYTQS